MCIVMNTREIIVIVMTVVVLPIDRPYNSFASEAKTLNVTVNLSNTGSNIGTYEIHVTAYGTETLEQSKVIDTSIKTCPEDIESLCYVKLVPFHFQSISACGFKDSHMSQRNPIRSRKLCGW